MTHRPATQRPVARRTLLAGAGAASLALLAGCGVAAGSAGGGGAATLSLSAIPDQDPAALGRLYPPLASLLSEATGVDARYRPVTDYPAVVRAFEVGDVALAWMGGLTGVQARSRVPGARAIVQRDVDADFHSLFIATTTSGIAPFTQVEGLRALAGHSLTFGSETSTSGRLMPQWFMDRAGLELSALRGAPGFSGSHDATIEAVRAGSFEVGAVNEQVWAATVAGGAADLSGVQVLFRTPGYHDYHWLVRPDVDDRFGAGTTAAITDALLGLDAADPRDAAVLRLFGAERFIPTENSGYDQVEAVATSLGLLA